MTKRPEVIVPASEFDRVTAILEEEGVLHEYDLIKVRDENFEAVQNALLLQAHGTLADVVSSNKHGVLH